MLGTQTPFAGTPYGTYQTDKENQADAVVQPEAIELDFEQQPQVVASSTPNMAPIGANPFESQSSLDKPAEDEDDDGDLNMSEDSVRGPASNF